MLAIFSLHSFLSHFISNFSWIFFHELSIYLSLFYYVSIGRCAIVKHFNYTFQCLAHVKMRPCHLIKLLASRQFAVTSNCKAMNMEIWSQLRRVILTIFTKFLQCTYNFVTLNLTLKIQFLNLFFGVHLVG